MNSKSYEVLRKLFRGKFSTVQFTKRVDSATVILAELNHFLKFKSASQMLSFARLETRYFQSDTSETTSKMVKYGSPYLRYVLMNCAITVVNYEPHCYVLR